MMTTSLAEGHLSDGDIVRLLDEELDPGERARVEAHVTACEECSRRVRGIRRRSARLGELLRSSDWEAPPAPVAVPVTAPEVSRDELARRRARRERERRTAPAPWLRAAAIVAVLLGVGIVATPLRAVVADWLETQWERIVAPGGREAPAAEPSAAPAEPAPGSRVQFVPQGSVFTLEVAARQAGGAVELARSDARQAVAEQVGGGTPADLLVLPSGVRIENDPASSASYRVVVPEHVRTVRVRVGDAPAMVLSAEEIAGGERVELGGR